MKARRHAIVKVWLERSAILACGNKGRLVVEGTKKFVLSSDKDRSRRYRVTEGKPTCAICLKLMTPDSPQGRYWNSAPRRVK